MPTRQKAGASCSPALEKYPIFFFFFFFFLGLNVYLSAGSTSSASRLLVKVLVTYNQKLSIALQSIGSPSVDSAVCPRLLR